jgi:hypothetical protein
MPTAEVEAYEKNAKEQYEALGRFVEAFEYMVRQVRGTCLEMLASSWEHGELVDVALNHPALKRPCAWQAGEGRADDSFSAGERAL